MGEVMSEWWEPDEEVLRAVMDGRYRLADMGETEQCWVVAELSERGWSTLRISEAMRCSQRHVKRLRAKVLTQYMRRVCRAGAEVELQRERAERAERDVLVIRRERDELRGLFGAGF